MRTIDIAGVMPEPPVMNRSGSIPGVAGLTGRVKSPWACERWSSWPGSASTRRLLTWPSAWERMVRAISSPAPEAGEEIEKQRVMRRAEPGRSRPTWTYWPARWPRQVAVGWRVSVATGAPGVSVSRRTSTTWARTSCAAHIGLIRER